MYVCIWSRLCIWNIVTNITAQNNREILGICAKKISWQFKHFAFSIIIDQIFVDLLFFLPQKQPTMFPSLWTGRPHHPTNKCTRWGVGRGRWIASCLHPFHSAQCRGPNVSLYTSFYLITYYETIQSVSYFIALLPAFVALSSLWISIKRRYEVTFPHPQIGDTSHHLYFFLCVFLPRADTNFPIRNGGGNDYICLRFLSPLADL